RLGDDSRSVAVSRTTHAILPIGRQARDQSRTAAVGRFRLLSIRSGKNSLYASASYARLAGIPLATLHSLQKLVLRGGERWFVQCARRLGYYPSRTLPRPSRRTPQPTLLRSERVLLDREHALLRLYGVLSHLHGRAQPPL